MAVSKLTIERLGINGEGVGYLEGYTVFVEGALPGEVVEVEFYERRKSFGRAKISTILQASPDRVTPPCPLFGRCGGCQLMHLAYPQQLEAKRRRVADALARIGKFTDCEVLPCVASPQPLNYRNKIQLPIFSDQETLKLGLYAKNSHDLIEIERCLIHCDLGEMAFQNVQKILKSSQLPAYDSSTGKGLLRHVLIKTAVHTQQVLVILVATEALPTSLAEQILASMPEIKGVVQNLNTASGNAILGPHFTTLVGEGSIEEVICGLNFKVSPASFFQVNPAQAEQLYQKAIEFAALNGKERVLDAYCGVGTLSLILSKNAQEVIGVECVQDAIEDAKENAIKNQIENVSFICAPAEVFISSLGKVDVAVLNPPRKGCEPNFLERLQALKPKRIVYISCDPATLARDLHYLSLHGYHLTQVQPFDMFPQTAHVETIACLVRDKFECE